MWRPRSCLLPLAILAALAAMPVGAASTPYRFRELFHKHSAALLRLKVTTLRGPLFTTGFLVDPHGTIVAAASAIPARGQVAVVADGGGELPAELLASDDDLGIAVLRAPSAGGLPALALGHSQGLRRGDWVVGLSHDDTGKPQGVAGCVSELARSIGPRRVRHVVIDAATEPGGPVLDLQGLVVAVAVRRKGSHRAIAVAVDELRAFVTAFVLPVHASAPMPPPAGASAAPQP